MSSQDLMIGLVAALTAAAGSTLVYLASKKRITRKPSPSTETVNVETSKSSDPPEQKCHGQEVDDTNTTIAAIPRNVECVGSQLSDLNIRDDGPTEHKMKVGIDVEKRDVSTDEKDEDVNIHVTGHEQQQQPTEISKKIESENECDIEKTTTVIEQKDVISKNETSGDTEQKKDDVVPPPKCDDGQKEALPLDFPITSENKNSDYDNKSSSTSSSSENEGNLVANHGQQNEQTNGNGRETNSTGNVKNSRKSIGSSLGGEIEIINVNDVSDLRSESEESSSDSIVSDGESNSESGDTKLSVDIADVILKDVISDVSRST